VSKHIDINQLLGEIGTSARAANDPWNLTRNYGGKVNDTALSPAVVADLGRSIESLTTEIQDSERIKQANAVSASSAPLSTAGSSSPGSSLLGGLLNLFPLASGIAKLFGLGDSSPDPAPTKYQLPTSISFAGSVNGPTSGVSSLSYDAYGLPRSNSSERPSNWSPFLTSEDASPAQARNLSTDVLQNLGLASHSSNSSDSPSVVGQLTSLAGSMFTAESTPSAVANLDLVSKPSIRNTDGREFPGTAGSDNGALRMESAPEVSASQKGQNILVQVQAMDSQSFMDHSQEIAQAVRQAMLNLNSLNDVILDL